MNDIGFFFEYNNRVVQLPVNPEKIEVSNGTSNKTTEIIQLGEINLIKSKKLSDFSFESFFPYEDWFPSIRTKGEFESTKFYKDFFIGLQEDAKPCRFIVTGLDINTLVTIETFDYNHQAGDHEDCYYSLKIKEYRDYRVREIKLKSSTTTSTTSTKGQSSNKVNIQPKQITNGSTVILNGRVHRDSYGASPGKTFKNYVGKISNINKKGTHPYHITTPQGGWLGWIAEGSVKLV